MREDLTDIFQNNIFTATSKLIDLNPSKSILFKSCVKRLLDLIKDRTGFVRKSAGILLAKLCQNEEILSIARSLHSTEILLTLQKVLLE